MGLSQWQCNHCDLKFTQKPVLMKDRNYYRIRHPGTCPNDPRSYNFFNPRTIKKPSDWRTSKPNMSLGGYWHVTKLVVWQFQFFSVPTSCHYSNSVYVFIFLRCAQTKSIDYVQKNIKHAFLFTILKINDVFAFFNS